MSKIQTKQCLKCNQNKEGINFEVPIIDTQPLQFVTKHYCWSDLEDLLKKELYKCEDWERNKKKLFKEWLIECQQHKTFDWPWREKSWGEYGYPSNWNKINTICVQCNVNLYWDTTPYEDSKHVCTYCSNCNSKMGIEGKTQDKHFYWNEKNLPVYKCEKRELIKPSKWYKQANCMNCDSALSQEKGKNLSWVSDQGSIYSYSNSRPNTKAHCVITTKRHVDDLRGLGRQEWDDILPVLKDTTKKIDKVYQPLGYMISIPVGKLAAQNYSHFYTRVVPKYREGKGSVGTGRNYKPATPEQIEKTKQVFQPNSENVIAEKSKVIARLHNETAFGYTVISTKQHLSIDIKDMDSETWNQIGEVALGLMKKFETGLDCHNFGITFRSGGLESIKILEKEKSAGIKEGGIDTSQFEKYYTKGEFRFIIFPKYDETSRWGGRGRRPLRKDGKGGIGSMENERIAEKLRDPEGYYSRVKGDRDYLKHKAERERERAKTDWKPWIWGGIIGATIVSIVWLIKSIKNTKKRPCSDCQKVLKRKGSKK